MFRKILKVRTTGSRATHDLRPELSDDFVKKYGKGVNFTVLEYNEDENWCVLECWCSNHPCLETAERKEATDLTRLSKDNSVLEVVSTHRLSPKILGTLSTSTHDSVNEETKEITVKGRKGKFLRKERERGTDGVERDVYVLDEG